MKRFKFSLEALLKIRSRTEESVKELLARKNSEIVKEETTLISIRDNLKQLQEESYENRAAESNITKLRYSVNFRNQLKLDLLECGNRIQRLQEEAFEIQQRLIKATQEKRAIEILKEKKKLEWKKKNRIIEQKFMDDISAQGYIRKSRSVDSATL